MKGSNIRRAEVRYAGNLRQLFQASIRCLAANDYSPEQIDAHAVAGFRTPEACADAIRAYCDWRAPTPPLPVDAALAATVRAAVTAAHRGALNEVESARLLAALGIPFTRSVLLRGAEAPVDLPFPVAAKIVSADIVHKTEAQGVELDIPDGDALRTRTAAMLARSYRLFPQAKIDGVLLQPMERGLSEVLIGFRRDPDVGPVVVLGAGGLLTELVGGHAVRLAPVSRDGA